MSTILKKKGRHYVFSNRDLELRVDPREVAFHVTEKRTGVEWRMAASHAEDVTVEDASGVRTGRAFASSDDRRVSPAPGGLDGATVRLADLGLELTVWLDGSAVGCRVGRVHDGCGYAHVRDVLWPRHFLLPKRPDAYTIWTVGQGSIVPGSWKGRFHHPEGYSEQEMCWQGSVIGRSGMCAIAETPFDLYVAMMHRPSEAPSTFIHWLPSHGDLRYARELTMTFARGLDFVEQAKLYRRWASERGYVVTLAEKARANPNVKRLRGGAMISSLTAIRRFPQLEYVCNSFADQAKWARRLRKQTGMKNSVVHVDGWGKYGYDSLHPDYLPPNAPAGGTPGLQAFRKAVKQAGWLFALHDQYIDIYADAPSWDPDLFMHKENGEPNILTVWAGGKCSHLCFSQAYRFVKRNIIEGVHDQYMYHNSPPVMKLCAPDAYYLDCFCRIHECFNPRHPLTRAEVTWYNNEMFKVVRHAGRGVVLSCEHAKFYGVPNLDFSYSVGHLKADVQTTTGEPGMGSVVGTPVPLWNLVFHDCVWGHAPGPAGLYHLLYCNGPSLQNTPEGLPPEQVEAVRVVSRLNEAAGFDEMTGFRLVDSDGMVRESEFASGVRVRANFAEGTYRLWGPKRVATKGTTRLPGGPA